jgi:hypothetical protein
LPTVLGEKLSSVLNDLERAQRAGDGDAIDYFNHRLDKLVQESRAARTQQPEHGGSGFDGGVRGTVSRPRPGMWPEPTSTQLMKQALIRHREEQAAREAGEQTIITNA